MRVGESVDVTPVFVGVDDAVVDGIRATVDVVDASRAPAGEPIRAVELLDDHDCLVLSAEVSGTDLDAVLDAVRTTAPHLPVFVVLADDDSAATALSAGATDVLRREAVVAGQVPPSRIENAVARHGDRTTAERYRGLVEHSTDVITVVGSNGTIQYGSPAVAELLGYDPDALVGEFVFNYIHPEDRDAIRETLIELMGQDETATVDVTYRFEHADGSWVWLETTGSNQKHSAVGGYVFNSRTITERKERERELAHERELLEVCLDTLNDVFYLLDTDGRLQRWNDRFEVVTGYDASDLAGMDAVELFEGEDRERAAAGIEETLETGSATVEAAFTTSDGTYIPYEFTGARLGAADDVDGLVGIGRDISERKERERELGRYETLVQAIPDEIYTMDEDGYHTSVVPQAGREQTVAGYDPEEMVGEHASMVMDEADIKRARAAVQTLVTDDDCNHVSFEMDLVTSNGERIPHENHIATLPSADGEFRGTVGILRDISERKEREQELRLKDRVIAEAPVGVAIADATRPSTPVVYANDGFEAVTGYDETDVRGRPLTFLAGPNTDERKLSTLQTAIDRRETVGTELLLYGQDGTPSWTRVSVAPVRNDGTVTHVVGFLEDVTDQKEYEQWIERQFDEFSDVIAEDLGEPIERARTHLEETGTDDESVETAREWLDRADRLVDDLTTVHSFEVKPREVSEATRRGSTADE